MKALTIGTLGLQAEFEDALSEILNAAQINFSWHHLSPDETDISVNEFDAFIYQETDGSQQFNDIQLVSDNSTPTLLISTHANGTIRFCKNHFVIPPCALNELPSILKNELKCDVANKKPASIPSNLFHEVVGKSMNEIFILDPITMTFLYANPSLMENLGYSISDFLSLKFSDLFTESYREAALDLINPLLDGKSTHITFQAEHKRADSTYYPVRIHLELADEYQTNYIIGVCSDISELKRSAKLLEERKTITRQLELSNKYKSTFFANLSHEMRTTLNSTLLLSEILSENREDNLTDEQISFIQTIQNSTNSLLTLLNEILDLSKIESGKMNMRPEYVSIDDFCKELERLYQPVASEKGLRFEFINELPEEIPFKTDRLRVEQVLKNFISNALKFTKEGTIKLRVFQPGAHKTNNGVAEYVAFQVSDTGIGIPMEKQKTIFKGYMQAEGAATESQYGGTGLGLAISKNIVELLGGKIELESSVGEGSKFSAVLPADSSESILKHAKEGKIKLTTTPAKQDINKPDKTTSGDKIDGTVLLVDDNETHNMALSEFLGFKIKHCLTADSSASALELLEKKNVDCIILDMYLPDASGKEVIKKLKQDERFASIPTIIYSGKNISGEEEEELENLADAIIQKNVMSYRILLTKVMSILQKASENTQT
jgi:PAS domain S-box-containing protein